MEEEQNVTRNLEDEPILDELVKNYHAKMTSSEKLDSAIEFIEVDETLTAEFELVFLFEFVFLFVLVSVFVFVFELVFILVVEFSEPYVVSSVKFIFTFRAKTFVVNKKVKSIINNNVNVSFFINPSKILSFL